MIASRRRADDVDDLALVFGDLPTSLLDDEEVDELGRVSPTMNPAVLRRERQAARVARRSRRKARSSGSEDVEAEEGYSTDSSLSPSDATDYHTAISGITADGKGVLADVHAVAFKDPSQGLGKWFSEWRNQYKDTYTNAWGGLGLVSAWEFWVRLEILGWNPFEVIFCSFWLVCAHDRPFIKDPRGLDTFTWYKSLYRYSHPATEHTEGAKLEQDGNLVSAMVSTAVIPRFCKIIEGGAFDPYSSLHVSRLLDLASQLETFVNVDHPKFHVGFPETLVAWSFTLAFQDDIQIYPIMLSTGCG